MKGPRLIVRALLVDGDRLLVNRHPGRLALFGGRVEKGETARRALTRELAEELGAQVELGPLAYVIESFYKDDRGRRIHELGLYYRVRLVAMAPRPIEKKLSPDWVPLDAVAASELRPRALRDRLARDLLQPGGPVELLEIDRGAFPKML